MQISTESVIRRIINSINYNMQFFDYHGKKCNQLALDRIESQLKIVLEEDLNLTAYVKPKGIPYGDNSSNIRSTT